MHFISFILLKLLVVPYVSDESLIIIYLLYWNTFLSTLSHKTNKITGKVTSIIVPAAAVGALGYGYMWWKVS